MLVLLRTKINDIIDKIISLKINYSIPKVVELSSYITFLQTIFST